MKNITLLSLMILMSACATPPNYRVGSYTNDSGELANPPQVRQKITEYTKLFHGKFSHIKIGKGLYQVSFTGNSSVSQAYVLEAIIQQSAVFALEEKYDHFTVVGQITSHESGGNHSGTATIKMTNHPNKSEVTYDAKIIYERIKFDEQKEMAEINERIEQENAYAEEYSRQRKMASEGGSGTCTTRADCSDGMTCKISNAGEKGQCVSHGIFGKLFNQ